MATRAQKKVLTFDKAGMLNIPSINEALKYFTEPKNGGYTRKTIVWLFQETYEIKIGNLSINMSYVLKDKTALERLLGDYLKNPQIAQKVNFAVETWIKENDRKHVAQAVEVALKKDAPIAE